MDKNFRPSVRILYFTDLAGGVCGRNLELQCGCFTLFSWWVVWAKLGTSVRILYFTDLAGGVCGRNLELQ